MSVADLYRSAVLDHNRNPRNFGEMADATHQARGLNALCGDDLHVFVRVSDDRIEAVSFTGVAGAITMACASMLTEHVVGARPEETARTRDCLERLLRGEELAPAEQERLGPLLALEGVRHYPSRIRAALLPWATLAAALAGEEIASTE